MSTLLQPKTSTLLKPKNEHVTQAEKSFHSYGNDPMHPVCRRSSKEEETDRSHDMGPQPWQVTSTSQEVSESAKPYFVPKTYENAVKKAANNAN
jgi:hypothetical protein